MFRLRGMEQEALLAQLGEAASEDESGPPAKPEPLPADPKTFWAMPPLPETLAGSLLAPAQSAALLRRLGPFPCWRGAVTALDGLEPVYVAMAAGALGAWGGISAAS